MYTQEELEQKRQHIELAILRLVNQEQDLQCQLDTTAVAKQQATGALILLNELLERLAATKPTEENTDG